MWAQSPLLYKSCTHAPAVSCQPPAVKHAPRVLPCNEQVDCVRSTAIPRKLGVNCLAPQLPSGSFSWNATAECSGGARCRPAACGHGGPAAPLACLQHLGTRSHQDSRTAQERSPAARRRSPGCTGTQTLSQPRADSPAFRLALLQAHCGAPPAGWRRPLGVEWQQRLSAVRQLQLPQAHIPALPRRRVAPVKPSAAADARQTQGGGGAAPPPAAVQATSAAAQPTRRATAAESTSTLINVAVGAGILSMVRLKAALRL